MKNKFFGIKEAQEKLSEYKSDFTLIKNPSFIYPPFEIVPLAEKLLFFEKPIKAVVSDMDGTTTSTEELCIHSLEYMVRLMSGKMLKNEWIGLDSVKDYPNIIGNSTTRHVEYLINTYENNFDPRNILKSYLTAAGRTIFSGKDPGRKGEVLNNLKYFSIEENRPVKFINTDDEKAKEEEYKKLEKQYLNRFLKLNHNEKVRIGIDIYYARYHEILDQISDGNSEAISRDLFGNPDKKLIEPMPGIGVFIPLVRGWINNNETIFYEQLLKEFLLKTGDKFPARFQEKSFSDFQWLVDSFKQNPAKIALVTSSIRYEAEIVIDELLSILRNIISDLGINEADKDFLLDKFSSKDNIYDAFITASDSNEIRLKPHRDLYSIALNQLGIKREDFNRVIGLEDSESGTIAIRAAGIGMSVALPFHQTAGHNFGAASHICAGGLPEIILKNKLYNKA